MQPLLPTPRKLVITPVLNGMDIGVRWRTPLAWFLLFFCLFWNGFLVVWMLLPSPVFFKLFALLHVAVGVGLAWYTVCLFVNTTNILIKSSSLEINTTPLYFPGFGSFKANRHDIKQVYIREKINRGRNSTSVSFQLYMLDNALQAIKLPLSSNEYEDLIYIKRKIEEVMDIAPEPVEGEYHP